MWQNPHNLLLRLRMPSTLMKMFFCRRILPYPDALTDLDVFWRVVPKNIIPLQFSQSGGDRLLHSPKALQLDENDRGFVKKRHTQSEKAPSQQPEKIKLLRLVAFQPWFAVHQHHTEADQSQGDHQSGIQGLSQDQSPAEEHTENRREE